MRLTASMRDRIKSKAVAAAFEERRKGLMSAHHALAKNVLATKITPKQQEAMDSLPASFFPKRCGCVYAKREDGESREFYSVSVDPETRIPACYDGGTILVGAEVWAEAVEVIALAKEIDTDQSKFEAELVGVLSATLVVENLLAHMPALKTLMPENFFVEKVKPSLPVGTSGALNALIAESLTAA